jgi:hypothetical protein
MLSTRGLACYEHLLFCAIIHKLCCFGICQQLNCVFQILVVCSVRNLPLDVE